METEAQGAAGEGVPALSPRQQRARISELVGANMGLMEIGEVYYPLSLRWWEKWRRYVGYEEKDEQLYEQTEDLHPGPIENDELKGEEEDQLKITLQMDQDIVVIPEAAYNLLKAWYGGGPGFPRRVVGMGNTKEARVELHPYFLRYTVVDHVRHFGKGRYRSKGVLMLDSTTTLREARKSVVQATGIKDTQVTQVWYKPLQRYGAQPPAGWATSTERNQDAEAGLVELPDRFSDDTLADLLYGQHSIQVAVETTQWISELEVGSQVDAKDDDGHWYDSIIRTIQPTGKYRVHYRCWEERWDANLELGDLAPLHTHSHDWRHFKVGMEVEIRSDKSGKSLWLSGKVVAVDEMAKQITVDSTSSSSPQLRGEKVDFDSEDICRMGVHIKDTKQESAILPVHKPAVPAGGHVLGSRSLYSPSSSYYSSGYNRAGTTEPGVVGLQNLGNTCFMNSMLQCLSNTEVLTTYFLEADLASEINEQNPLGTGGKLTRAYARMLKDMWSGLNTSISPVEVKRVVGLFQPQFAGYQQHDSQELMSFLLDGLHEDLNRVSKKPYVPVKDYEGEADEEVARESWERYLRRDDSKIVDHCVGLYRSHVTCPNCGYESVTFDPYSSITLQLPVVNKMRLEFTFHPLPYGSAPIKAAVSLPTTAMVPALKEWIMENLAGRVGDDEEKEDELDDGDWMMVEQNDANGMGAGVKKEGGGMEDVAPTGSGSPQRDERGNRLRKRQSETMIDVVEIFQQRVYGVLTNDEQLHKYAKPAFDVHAFELDMPYEQGRVTCVSVGFGKARTTHTWSLYPSSRGYDKFGLPFRVPISKETTGRDVHQRIWKSVQRLLHGKEGDVPLEYEERPYKVIWANVAMSTDDGELEDDDTILMEREKLVRKSVLVVLFAAEDYAQWVDVQAFQQVAMHESVVQRPEDGRKKVITLTDCFSKFCEREQLGRENMWYCTKCKDHWQAYKKMDVWSTPDVLILHLKRFSYLQGPLVTREKIEDLVQFPIDGLDLTSTLRGPTYASAPPIYDLYAVSEHSGGLGGGHYTAVAKNFRNDKWISFNDSYVNEIGPDPPEEKIVTNRAYVLFYRRREGSLRWAGALPERSGVIVVEDSPASDSMQH